MGLLDREKKSYEVSADKNTEKGKETLDKDSEKVAAATEFPYNVRIIDVSGSSSFEKGEFPVQR